jgi:hypothetical protein
VSKDHIPISSLKPAPFGPPKIASKHLNDSSHAQLLGQIQQQKMMNSRNLLQTSLTFGANFRSTPQQPSSLSAARQDKMHRNSPKFSKGQSNKDARMMTFQAAADAKKRSTLKIQSELVSQTNLIENSSDRVGENSGRIIDVLKSQN